MLDLTRRQTEGERRKAVLAGESARVRPERGGPGGMSSGTEVSRRERNTSALAEPYGSGSGPRLMIFTVPRLTGCA
jgi:hypothetical protein